MNPSLLDNIVIVLDHPQNLVNIAGVVRAMKNMGITRLRLVNPDEFDGWRIGGIAHRSQDVVENAQIFESLQNRWLIEAVISDEDDVPERSEVEEDLRYGIRPLLAGAVIFHLGGRNIIH